MHITLLRVEISQTFYKVFSPKKVLQDQCKHTLSSGTKISMSAKCKNGCEGNLICCFCLHVFLQLQGNQIGRIFAIEHFLTLGYFFTGNEQLSILKLQKDDWLYFG
jgi:hypothetical protein